MRGWKRRLRPAAGFISHIILWFIAYFSFSCQRNFHNKTMRWSKTKDQRSSWPYLCTPAVRTVTGEDTHGDQCLLLFSWHRRMSSFTALWRRGGVGEAVDSTTSRRREMEPNKVTPKVRPVTPPLSPHPTTQHYLGALKAEETEFIVHFQDQSGLRICWQIVAAKPNISLPVQGEDGCCWRQKRKRNSDCFHTWISIWGSCSEMRGS